VRQDIHSAFDEIAPSMAGLPERVVQTVLSEGSSRQRRERLMFRLRGPLSLVALFILVAMVVGVLIAGRLMQDWNAFHNAAPAGDARQAELAQLEARPLALPQLNAGDPCPETPINAAGLYGFGPVHGEMGYNVSTAWGTYWYVAAVTDARLSALVLIRGRDLITSRPAIFVGQYATGPVLGTDTLDGKLVQQHLEAVVDTSHPSPSDRGAQDYTWPFTNGLAKGESGCTGWQIDTTGYATETFVTRHIPG
jgi:hypothetical protein